MRILSVRVRLTVLPSEDENTNKDLQPSELGTRQYWDSIYERDVVNYEDHGDVGEIWFGEDNELRISRWLQKNCDPRKFVIDLGCGNGMMLVELARAGFTNLSGVDYSTGAIELAKRILNSQALDNITLKAGDLTAGKLDLNGFDVALDKGTYDAISLNPDDVRIKRKQYIKNISSLLVPQGLLIITSCNWTEAEIVDHFKEEFQHLETIPTPKFMFGGKVGNVVSSLVLRKL